MVAQKSKSLFPRRKLWDDKRHTFRLSQHNACSEMTWPFSPFGCHFPKKFNVHFTDRKHLFRRGAFLRTERQKTRDLLWSAQERACLIPRFVEKMTSCFGLSPSLSPSLPIPPSRFRIGISPLPYLLKPDANGPCAWKKSGDASMYYFRRE